MPVTSRQPLLYASRDQCGTVFSNGERPSVGGVAAHWSRHGLVGFLSLPFHRHVVADVPCRH
jgi:hypothetical protein